MNGKNIKSYKLFGVILLHCISLFFAWHAQESVFFLFLAFIPVFYCLDNVPETYNNKLKLYIFSFLASFFWIYLTIYWIKPIHPISHFIICLLSASILFIPYVLAYYFRFAKKSSATVAQFVFISAWIIIELGHDLNLLGFPYLNLGHTLAAYSDLIQWYAWTGSIGGTLWILLINLGLYHLIKRIREVGARGAVKSLGISLFVTGLPIVLSFFLGQNSQKGEETSLNVICLHTSADVYNYKYDVEPDVLLEDYLTTTLTYMDTTKQNLVVWPENALTGDILLAKLDSGPIRKIEQKLCKLSNSVLISGAMVDEVVARPDSSRYLPNILYNKEEKFFFKRYNSALLVRSNGSTLMQTKKRLVPFGEKVPSHKIFSPFVSFLPNLANLNFSSRQDEYPVFSIVHDSIQTTPIICYGSVFSSHVADEILATKSNFMVVLMNEGWMKNEKAFSHFNWFSVCRAIENGRQLIKSSNEGMSSIINSNGEVEKHLIGAETGAIQGKIRINNDYTFYSIYHAAIHYGMLIICFGFILFHFIRSFK